MKAAICLIVSLTDEDPEGHGHLTWDMCREMQASGLVEIGSHTYALTTWSKTATILQRESTASSARQGSRAGSFRCGS